MQRMASSTSLFHQSRRVVSLCVFLSPSKPNIPLSHASKYLPYHPYHPLFSPLSFMSPHDRLEKLNAVLGRKKVVKHRLRSFVIHFGSFSLSGTIIFGRNER